MISSDEIWIINEDKKYRFYWWLSSIAIFLLVPIDMITSIFAASIYGAEAEANWIIEEAIKRGPLVFGGINLIAGFLVSILFYILIGLIKKTDGTEKWVLSRAFEIWVLLLITSGLFVASNNLLVIFASQSLL